MEMQEIKQTLLIDATKEKVWNVLTKDELNRQWYAEFSEGTYADTDWKVGSKAIFTDGSQSGLIAKILVNEPNKALILEYTGELKDGVEDYDSESAQKLKGGKETYQIFEKDGKTQLDITGDMDPEFYAMMSEAWDKAVVKIKELAEKD